MEKAKELLKILDGLIEKDYQSVKALGINYKLVCEVEREVSHLDKVVEEYKNDCRRLENRADDLIRATSFLFAWIAEEFEGDAAIAAADCLDDEVEGYDFVYMVKQMGGRYEAPSE